jgi:DNA-binding NarL/FixJ family response regulator
MHPTAKEVLVIDDHPMMRDAFHALLTTLDPDAKVRVATSLAAGLALLDEAPVDYLIVDLTLPDASGFMAIQRLRADYPGCPLVVWSGITDSATVIRCIELGACGYIPKSFERGSVLEALRTVLAGNVYLPRLDQLESASVNHPLLFPNGSTRTLADLGLSPRQFDVLRLLVKGYSNKVICRELDIAEGTVKIHVSGLLAKLGARNRTEAVIAASHMDLGTDAAVSRAPRPVMREQPSAGP